MHLYYSYNEFRKDVVALAQMVEADFKPQAIVSILRGGMTLAHFLGLYWDTKEVYAINASSYGTDRKQGELVIDNVPKLKPTHQEILVVDEIVDSGRSFLGVMQVLKEHYPNAHFKSAVLFAHKSAHFQADYTLKEATSWIDFFWEVDTQGDHIA
ncbi:phosphoribosyltransferase [Helicobacter heilmannii]|uniref:phosphoribosyltransferase n=1 Tax=Helicobacter heilmannii TaxID=35817 RepID=UPI0006A16B8F|nr:phosphoribosyltransferase family protein [Helicobacter heilmannii]CRF48571.1 Xanthine-guanine phosphoribosyltransferase [Helicobacter heilmannii]